MYILIPIYQFILPHLTPCNHKFIFYIFNSFCFVDKFIRTLFLDSTSKWYYILFIFTWLTSLSMIISRSLHFAANGIISFFLWLSNIPLWIHNHTFFIYSSADGHLGYFHVLDIVNSAAVSTGMHVSFQIRVFIFFQIFAHEWDCWIIWQLNFYFILFYFFF